MGSLFLELTNIKYLEVRIEVLILVRIVFGNENVLRNLAIVIWLLSCISLLACGQREVTHNSKDYSVSQYPVSDWRNFVYPDIDETLKNTDETTLRNKSMYAGNRELRLWIFRPQKPIEGLVLKDESGVLSAFHVTRKYFGTDILRFRADSKKLSGLWAEYSFHLKHGIKDGDSASPQGEARGSTIIVLEVRNSSEYKAKIYHKVGIAGDDPRSEVGKMASFFGAVAFKFGLEPASVSEALPKAKTTEKETEKVPVRRRLQNSNREN